MAGQQSQGGEGQRGEKRKLGGGLRAKYTPAVPRFKFEPYLPFNEQVERMIDQIQQSRREREAIPLVLDHIKTIFRQIVPNVEPILFGSSRTNLAMIGGDLDVFLFCPDGQPESLIKDARTIFRKSPWFRMSLFLVNTRIPLIKTTHFGTHLKVDISALSLRGVNNSMLLEHIVKEGDPRIRPFLMFLNWWGKRYDLVKTGYISSFCLDMMAIFFLQYGCLPCVVPPLHGLIEHLENSWPVSFNKNPSLLVSQNTQSLGELIVGFFQFYSNFDFFNFVISPFHGEPVDLKDFLNPSQLPDSFRHYRDVFSTELIQFVFRNPERNTRSLIFVQEPLELGCNAARYMDESLFATLKLALEIASAVLPTCRETQWIQLLFFEMPIFSLVKQRSTYEINLREETPFWKVASACEIVMKDMYKLLIESFHSSEGTPNKLMKLDKSSMEAYLKLSGDPTIVLGITPSNRLLNLQLKPAVLRLILSHFKDKELLESKKFSDCISCVFHISKKDESETTFVVVMYDTMGSKKGRFRQLLVMQKSLQSNIQAVLDDFDGFDRLQSLTKDFIRTSKSKNIKEFESTAETILRKFDRFTPLLSN